MSLLRPEEWRALALSLDVAGRAVAIDIVPAIGMAWLLSREFRGRALLDAIVLLPLVLPPVVTGWVLLLVLGPHGPLGRVLLAEFGIRLAFTTAGAAIACAVMTFPLIVRAVRLGFESLDPGLMAAAAGLGAGPADRTLTVALPLVAPFILAGLVTGLAASLGEFGAVITFAADIPGVTETLPIAIFAALQQPGGEAEAARLSLVSATLALIGLFGADLAARRLVSRSETATTSLHRPIDQDASLL